ncbi:uncharacterized protein BCR38DRAFT_448818 [Pseudomassariella vexata]|uniref:Beta-glucuronidase C-terminal domain-containing protein n=1 Tax=Pseudomassariella vexata TaxID=1141098 RepID=A0A1Y2DEZ6_9PEZI|nr:uncharacterized protein BCR38DRAFT_448818 [Pseudomassariella vexata]ORY57850.1 hypothetical protein BCR38DRAFT_448818 [Pseudomassariella vexata]
MIFKDPTLNMVERPPGPAQEGPGHHRKFLTSPLIHILSSAFFCIVIVVIAFCLVIYLPDSQNDRTGQCFTMVHKLSPFLGLGALGLCATIPRDGAFALSVPPNSSETAYVDTAFIGFAFEQASFNEYARDNDGTINAFSTNLIDNTMSRTGGTPLIRVGGTSADYGRYVPGQDAVAIPKAEVDNYQNVGNTTIGPGYWELCQNFPNAQYIIQIPLATTNVNETVAWAKSAVEIVGIDKIQAIELGNEPDLYSPNFTEDQDGVSVTLGPPDYQGKFTNETYVRNWTTYAAAVIAGVDLPTEPIFQAFDVAAHVGADIGKTAYVLDTETCFNLGINQDNIIKTVAHHYYQNQAGSAETLATGLMTMSVTHNRLDLHKRRINWLKANRPEIPFILSEVGNSLKKTHTYEYQNRLGSALWQVDFYLYAMAIGVTRINYQQIMHAGYNLWLPVESAGMPAQVFANYYSQPFVADFIGSSGKTTMQKVEFTNAGSETNVAAYVAFEDGAPKRVAITNLHYWNATSSGIDRPSVQVGITVPDGVASVKVYHLSSPDGAGAGAESITYGGSQWTYESVGKEITGVQDDTETIDVMDGVAMVAVNSSEAVLVWL